MMYRYTSCTFVILLLFGVNVYHVYTSIDPYNPGIIQNKFISIGSLLILGDETCKSMMAILGNHESPILL